MKSLIIFNDEKRWEVALTDDVSMNEFEYFYGIILSEYFQYLKDNENATILEYFKHKLDDPMLANFLNEENFETDDGNIHFEEKEEVDGKTIVYKRKLPILFKIETNDGYELYLYGSYIFVLEKDTGKKYFYYTD